MDSSTQLTVGYSADTRAHFAARLRLNLARHSKTGVPLAPASVSGIIEETFADELPFEDGDFLAILANLIDPGVCRNTRGPSATRFTCSECGATAPSNSIVVTGLSEPQQVQIVPIERCPFCGRQVLRSSKPSFTAIEGGLR